MQDRLDSFGQATSTTFYYADKLGIESVVRFSLMYYQGTKAVYPIADDAYSLHTFGVDDDPSIPYYNDGAACSEPVREVNNLKYVWEQGIFMDIGKENNMHMTRILFLYPDDKSCVYPA